MKNNQGTMAAILMAALLSANVLAEPAVSANASQGADVIQGRGSERQKTLESNSGSGSRSSSRSSKEHSTERSRETTKATKEGREQRRGKEYTIRVNANPILIQAFMDWYEKPISPLDRVIIDKAIQTNRVDEMIVQYGPAMFFSFCQPFRRLSLNYPVLTNFGSLTTWEEAMAQMQRGRGVIWDNTYKDKVWPPSERAMRTHSAVSDYAMCRMAAHYWLAEAGNRLLRLSPPNDENELRQNVLNVFSQMDGDESLWERIHSRVATEWQTQAACRPFLQPVIDMRERSMDCVVFAIQGNAVSVNMKPTLSTDAIDGREFSIAITSGASRMLAEERNTSTASRVSDSSRQGDEAERYVEKGTSARLSRSRASRQEETASSKREAGSSIKAVPTQ